MSVTSKKLTMLWHDIKPLDNSYISQTRLGFTASLTHAQTTTYLDELLDRGLIIETETDFKPHPYYEITERGRRCLELFGELDDDLRSSDQNLFAIDSVTNKT